MRVTATATVQAPRQRVWDVISDPDQYCGFMVGATHWDVDGLPTSGRKLRTGIGARWRIRMKVGSAQVGGTVEVVEFEEPGDLAWNSVTGVSMRSRWRLRELSPGRTAVTLRLAYQAPGGIVGLIADRIAAIFVGRQLERSLHNLQALVEQHEQAH